MTYFSLYLAGRKLKMSAFNYNSVVGTLSGSFTIEGFDDATFISDNSGGTLTLYLGADSTGTAILTTPIVEINAPRGVPVEQIELVFDDGTFSQSAASSFAVDLLASNAPLNGGYYNFTLPSFSETYQAGMTVTYTSVSRYIESVTVTVSSPTSITTTMSESSQPPEEETEAGDPGMPGCTTLLTVGLPSSTGFSTFCSAGYGPLYEYFTSPEGYHYDMYVFAYRQFSLPVETTIKIEFQTIFGTGLNFDGTNSAASGFEFDLIQGEYTPFTKPGPTVYTFRGNGEFNGTVSAGIYTVRMTLYLNRPDDSIAWASSNYYLYVYEP
jgi:hypothetical protein